MKGDKGNKLFPETEVGEWVTAHKKGNWEDKEKIVILDDMSETLKDSKAIASLFVDDASFQFSIFAFCHSPKDILDRIRDSAFGFINVCEESKWEKSL